MEEEQAPGGGGGWGGAARELCRTRRTPPNLEDGWMDGWLESLPDRPETEEAGGRACTHTHAAVHDVPTSVCGVSGAFAETGPGGVLDDA